MRGFELLQQLSKGQSHRRDRVIVAIPFEVDIPSGDESPGGPMSPSDPNETMTSAAVTILALFRDSSQGELEMPGASG